jgi:hypothetical protein
MLKHMFLFSNPTGTIPSFKTCRKQVLKDGIVPVSPAQAGTAARLNKRKKSR